MTSIPTDAWFCEQCQLRGISRARASQEAEVPVETGDVSGHSVLFPPAPRGRGRPASKPKLGDSSGYASFTGTAGGGALRSSASLSSLLRFKGQGMARSISGTSVAATAVVEPEVVSLQVALDFIQAKTDPSFTPAEKAILEQLRRWAPLCDLKILYGALKEKNVQFQSK